MTLSEAKIDTMPRGEELTLPEKLSGSISTSAYQPLIPDWHNPLLDDSLKRIETHPDDCSNWPDVKARLQKDA